VVSRLDVVAELWAHQQNLSPAPGAPRAALIALPPPALVVLVAPDGMRAARSRALAALAEELGGGDGPLPIIELGATGGLTGQLAQLWERGIRELVVDGAREQPGHARALRYRWPGAVRTTRAPWLDALFDPAEPVRVLAPGVVRVAPGVPAPAGVERVLAAVDDDGDPRRVAEQGPHVWPYAIDPDRRLGVWSGVVPPRAAYATAAGAELRARWSAWWTARGRPEIVGAAVLGLDPALEADLRQAPASSAVERRARLIAITGIDGAGKSSHVARLADLLRDRGARVRVIKLYRQGAFLELANELGARTRRGAPLAAFRVSRVIKLIDSLRVHRDQIVPALAACDAVIFDRHVETHVAAAESQLGWDLSAHPALAAFSAPDLRFWLTLDPIVALERREARGEPASADEHAVGLTGYAQVFARLAAGPGEIALDATAPAHDNARAIAERAAALVPGGGGDPGREPLVAASAPRRAPPPASPCAVHIGADPARLALGDDVLALRAELAGWCGAAAAGIPEAFWLEAYAAQLVLDVITRAPAQAVVALWPAAVAAMADHGELVMLAELTRILASLVVVERYDPRAETYEPMFHGLGAGAAAARRLARDYAAQLERCAAEHGWPRRLA
jgi:dTMP kinase